MTGSRSSHRLSQAKLQDKRANGTSAQRFNEQVDRESVRSSVKLSQKNLGMLAKTETASQARSQKSLRSRSVRSGGSVAVARTAADVHRKKILQYVNGLSENDLEKVSEMLAKSEVFPAEGEEQARPEAEVEEPVEDEDAKSVCKSVAASRMTSKTFISNLQH